MVVYIFKDEDDPTYFKVGRTNDLQNRLRSALTYRPSLFVESEEVNPYGVAHDADLETFIHAELTLQGFRDWRYANIDTISSDREIFRWDNEIDIALAISTAVMDYGYVKSLVEEGSCLRPSKLLMELAKTRELANAARTKAEILRQSLLDINESDPGAFDGLPVEISDRKISKFDINSFREGNPGIYRDYLVERESKTVIIKDKDLKKGN